MGTPCREQRTGLPRPHHVSARQPPVEGIPIGTAPGTDYILLADAWRSFATTVRELDIAALAGLSGPRLVRTPLFLHRHQGLLRVFQGIANGLEETRRRGAPHQPPIEAHGKRHGGAHDDLSVHRNRPVLDQAE